MKIENIKVRTVDVEKLIDLLAIELPENEKLSIDKFAVYKNNFAIDIDCCFWEINNAHFKNEIQPVIDIDCRIKTYKPDGSYKIRMDQPDFTKTISLKEFLELSTEVNLIDFIRYNYNPRFQGNQNLLMEHINQLT